MTYIPLERAKLSTLNSVSLYTTGGSQNTKPYNLNNGTVTSSTTNTIVLGSGSSVDSVYNNLVIQIVDGKGFGQFKLINSYVGSTKTATINSNWDILPDSTSTYVVHVHSGQCQSNDQNEPATTIKLSSNESSVDEYYNNTYIKILMDDGSEQIREIVSYDGTTKIASLRKQWNELPINTSLYIIYGESGTSTSATSTTIVLDGNQSSIVGQYHYIEILDGDAIGEIREITNISTNTVTVSPAWTTTPSATSKYTIFGGWGGTFENIKGYSMITVTNNININLGKVCGLLSMNNGINTTGIKTITKLIQLSSASATHTLSVTSNQFKLKIICIGIGLNGDIQTIYHTYSSAKQTAAIDEPLAVNTDCDIVRSVITGQIKDRQYKNARVDNTGSLQVNISKPVTAFGELSVQQSTPVIAIKFIYGLPTQQIEQLTSYGTYATMGTEGEVGTAQVQTIYLPKGSSLTSSGAGDYFTLEDGGGSAFYVWFNVSSGNTDPSPGGTGLQVDVTAADTPSEVATAASAVIGGSASFSTSVFGNTITITNATSTDANPASINIGTMPTTSNSTIVSTKGSSMITLTNGAGVGDYAVMRSRRSIQYRPGIGCLGRFTYIFDTPVANTYQYAGFGNSASALYFAYHGTQFGILRKTGGVHAIYSIQITSVTSATTGTIIVTVDGMDFTITLSDVSTVQSVAQQIQDIDYRSALYNTEIINDTVYFISERLTATTGTYTFALTLGTATNITSTVTEITSVVPATDVFIEQYNWNIDRMDGNGPSGIILNQQTGNVYQISYQWLGFGNITFFIEDKDTSLFQPVHIIKYANTTTIPSMTHPDLQLTYVATSTSSVNQVTGQSSCGSGFVQGNIVRSYPNFTVSNSHTGISTSSTNVILISIANPRIFRGIVNQIEIILRNISYVSTKGSNNTKCSSTFSIVIGGTPSNSLIYTYTDENNSSTIVATPSAGTTLSGGEYIYSTSITAEGTVNSNIFDNNIMIQKNETVYLVYSNTAPSTGDIDLSSSINWVEDH